MRATARPGSGRVWRRRSLGATLVTLVAASGLALARPAAAEDGGTSDAPILGIWEVQSLNGVNNNEFDPNVGRAGANYLRLAPTRYADGLSQPVAGPNSRNISNRVFNDVNQNLFSERRVTQWGFAWGQFIDHTIGLRDEAGTVANIPFTASDPMEAFTNTLGAVPFTRSKAAPGTGTTRARQQVNTVSTWIDASAVYGDTDTRLDWLREGSVDGNPDNNGARLLMPSNYLPRRDSRGNAATAPTSQVDGRLLATPAKAVVAGDVRANENIALTATQTLFAREHNRIVSLLPASLSAEDKFQIARAVVVAEQQYITYTQFLPAMGINLPAYSGYNPNIDSTLANEFATVGYRAHSQIHGEFEIETESARYSAATLAALEAQGIEVEVDGADVEIAVPINVASFNPDLVSSIQLGPLLKAIGGESEYKNDEMIDNQLRSVLFQVPVAGNVGCLDGPTLPQCFRGVVDLGAIDVERGRDHGMPTYNQLRAAYGLPAKTTFRAITGEASEAFPADPLLTPGNEVNDPNSLDFTQLFDINGNPVVIGSEEAADTPTRGVRRTPLAARLKAIYGSVSNVDAFVGMVSEPHVNGTEFGELQLAIWKEQFQASRDGDRFFYLNDPLQTFIRQNFGIDSRRTLAQIIAANTDIPLADLAANVFLGSATPAVAATPALDAVPAATATTLTRGDLRGGGGGKAADPALVQAPSAVMPGRALTTGKD
jgi:hypothetical protein